jgi:hypothetical protein
MTPETNLTPKETAARLRCTTGTLSNWRVQGVGPKFIKVGRKVLYPTAQVAAYENGQLRQNTAA